MEQILKSLKISNFLELTYPLNKNTEFIVKKANARMRILHKISEFNPPVEDMLTIYMSYIRSIVEQSCTVWHSRLTQENIEDLERIQKSALRIIMKEE